MCVSTRVRVCVGEGRMCVCVIERVFMNKFMCGVCVCVCLCGVYVRACVCYCRNSYNAIDNT